MLIGVCLDAQMPDLVLQLLFRGMLIRPALLAGSERVIDLDPETKTVARYERQGLQLW